MVAELVLVRPMERQLPLTFAAIVFSTIFVLSGCQKKNAATNLNSESQSELHGSTKVLQAADLVGYNGTKLRNSVDRIKQANDKRNREMEKKIEGTADE
jgi:hypothetical protein